MDIKALFQASVDSTNDRDWDRLSSLFQETIQLNNREMPASTYVDFTRRGLGSFAQAATSINGVIQNPASRSLAARLVVHTVDKAGNSADSPKHLFVWFSPDEEKIIALHVIDDKHARFAFKGAVVNCPSWRGSPPLADPGFDLEATYRTYIGCINARTTERDLPRYLHSPVVHNGDSKTIDEYRRLMEVPQDAIPDLTFHIKDLVVDKEAQTVAALLYFTGKPVKAWEGAEPNGKSIDFDFYEQAYYWFDQGKIKVVVSLVDMDAYYKHFEAK